MKNAISFIEENLLGTVEITSGFCIQLNCDVRVVTLVINIVHV